MPGLVLTAGKSLRQLPQSEYGLSECVCYRLCVCFLRCARALPCARLQIAPQVAYIHGAGSRHHLLFTAVYDDSSERDVTEQVKLTFDSPDVLETASQGQMKALKEGIAKLRAEFEGQHAESVVIVQPKRTEGIDFIHDVAPYLHADGL